MNSIRLKCANCERKFKVKPELAGRKVKCPCGQSMRVPQPSIEAAQDPLELAAFEFSDSNPYSAPTQTSLPVQQSSTTTVKRKTSREVMALVGGWLCVGVVGIFLVLGLILVVLTGNVRFGFGFIVLSAIPGMFAIACLLPKHRHISVRILGAVMCLLFLGGFIAAFNDEEAKENIRKPGIFLVLAAAMGTMAVKGKWPFGDDD